MIQAGIRTLRALDRGLVAVIVRLAYGATKHPGDPWRGKTEREHTDALLGHAEALRERDYDLPPPERRKHLAAIACRALMALTVDAANENEKQAQPEEPSR